MTIAQVSKQCGLSHDTLRYYERIGLLPAVTRGGNGKRDYGPEDLKWIDFIKCMRGAGISVDALAQYVSLTREGEHTQQARKTLLIQERDQLAQRVAAMCSTLERLNTKIAAYDQRIAPRASALQNPSWESPREL